MTEPEHGLHQEFDTGIKGDSQSLYVRSHRLVEIVTTTSLAVGRNHRAVTPARVAQEPLMRGALLRRQRL